jgi:hypothetical protein
MPNNVFTVRNTFCPYKNYNSILGDKLTVFKLCNCGIVLAMVSHVIFWIVSTYIITYEAYFVVGEFKGPRETTGGGVNGSPIKFFCENGPLSQVETPNPKPYNKLMNTLTNSVEMIPSKLQMQQKKNGINWTPG